MQSYNWLLWLLIGVAAGWLLEFLIDYFFFGRRNRELAAQAAAAQAETENLVTAQADLNARLTTQAAAAAALQSKGAQLESAAAGLSDLVQLVAVRRGLVGALGNALVKGDRDGLVQTLGAIEEDLAAKEPLERTVQHLQSYVSTLNAELSQVQAGQHQARQRAASAGMADDTVRRRLALLIGAGGLLRTLGLALRDGDETAIGKAIGAVERDLKRTPAIVTVEVQDTRTVEALKGEAADAQAERKALQVELADLTAATIAMVSRIGLVSAAGGPLAALGAALASGDEAAVMASVRDIDAGLAHPTTTASTKSS